MWWHFHRNFFPLFCVERSRIILSDGVPRSNCHPKVISFLLLFLHPICQWLSLSWVLGFNFRIHCRWDVSFRNWKWSLIRVKRLILDVFKLQLLSHGWSFDQSSQHSFLRVFFIIFIRLLTGWRNNSFPSNFIPLRLWRLMCRIHLLLLQGEKRSVLGYLIIKVLRLLLLRGG